MNSVFETALERQVKYEMAKRVLGGEKRRV